MERRDIAKACVEIKGDNVAKREEEERERSIKVR